MTCFQFAPVDLEVTFALHALLIVTAGTVNGRKPLSYCQYCRRYTNWLDSTKVTFHIQRIPDANLELDFAGKTLCIHDQRDSETITKVTIFVAALSFSDL